MNFTPNPDLEFRAAFHLGVAKSAAIWVRQLKTDYILILHILIQLSSIGIHSFQVRFCLWGRYGL